MILVKNVVALNFYVDIIKNKKGSVMKKINKIVIELTDQEVWDLAQFFKRSTFKTYQDCAIRSKDDEETYRMEAAAMKVYSAFRNMGFDPR